MYKELEEAITEIFCDINEDSEFKRALKRLIENSLKNNVIDNDILSVLKLTNTYNGGE